MDKAGRCISNVSSQSFVIIALSGPSHEEMHKKERKGKKKKKKKKSLVNMPQGRMERRFNEVLGSIALRDNS